MADLYTLLTLPVTSTAFSELPDVTGKEDDDDGSDSPLRKVPRLGSSSDSVSASRRRNANSKARERDGPVHMQLLGDPIKPSQEIVHDQAFLVVKRSIRILLSRHTSEKLPSYFENVYRKCRFVVTVSKRGASLYESLKLDLERCVGGLANELIQTAPDHTQWMQLFVEICRWYETQVSLLKSLLTYLDQLYLINEMHMRSVGDLAFLLFLENILQNPRIVDCMRQSTHEWITWEREHKEEHPMRPLVKELVLHLQTHDQYHPLFEDYYLDITRSFYVEESKERSEAFKTEAHKFIEHVCTRVDEELQRSRAVFPESSGILVEQATENALMESQLDWLATDALKWYMENKDRKGLVTLYLLFSRVSDLKVLASAFKTHVMTTVQQIVRDQLLDDSMVQRLLDFKSFADSLVNFVFVEEPTPEVTELAPQKAATNNNSQFGYALIDAFQTGFRARRNKPAEMIAKYIDKAAREPTRDAAVVDYEHRMDAVLALYRFTEDKDVFRTFYHRALAKRLLLGRSASDDDEKGLLKKLKEHYDPEFGMGDHMFNDLALSREMTREFHSKCSPTSRVLKLTVMVLQQSVWPFAPRKAIVDLPSFMKTDLIQFGDYYEEKHKGRKLEWDHALGTMTLRAKFDKEAKELSVSLYQGVVLLMFNDSTRLSYTEILEHTRMDESELKRTLQSLACGKKRVLKKSPVGREVEEEDVFRFNGDFTDPRPKIHINSIQVKETPEETQRTHISVEGDRKHYLDAAIVRVMKAKKEMSYEKLKVAVIDAVKGHFVPEVSVVKQRIQWLVEQEYLKRDEEDMNMYQYVA